MRWVAALVGAAAVFAGTPGALASPSIISPSTTSPSGASHSGSLRKTTAMPVPPPAPKPTGRGNSPDAPDPHPPLGGRAPDGSPVGGAAMLSRGLVLPKGAPRLPAHITARSWVVADLDTGEILGARDPHGRYQPASIQKLLTAVTLLPLLPGRRIVTATERAATTEGSHAGLVAGGRYSVDDLFHGLLLVSGNDTAEALADAAGGRAHTVALMNAEARRLGAYDTFVQTPSGLDGWQQLTSAYDMMLVLRAALHQPRFVAYDRVPRTHLPAQRRHGVGALELDNQNQVFLSTVRGALVAKTGYTDAAQHTFVGAIRRNGHRYGVVLMRAQRWPLDQWQQATRLVSWAAALPAAGTAVGRLQSPAPPILRTKAAAATVPASPSASPSASTSPAKHDKKAISTRPGLLVLAVLVGAALYLSYRLRRRSERHQRGDADGTGNDVDYDR